MSESRTKREKRAREIRAEISQYMYWLLPYIREARGETHADRQALEWLRDARKK